MKNTIQQIEGEISQICAKSFFGKSEKAFFPREELNCCWYSSPLATYTLCPLMGIKTFALQPEKMINYGLQAEAASFTFHLLIELVLGWLFTFIGYKKERSKLL